MYADDTHLTYADNYVNIIQSCLNEDLLNISKWLIANKLTLNMTKTKAKHPNCLSRSEHQGLWTFKMVYLVPTQYF